MRSTILMVAVALAAVAGSGSGCSRREPEPMPRSRIPQRPAPVPVRERDEIKPLPDASRIPPPPYDDVPLINQRPPEQRAFVDAYEAVGRPRIMVFVNRTLQGEIVRVAPPDPFAGDDRSPAGRGPAEAPARDDDYLRPGQYEEPDARTLAYDAMEYMLIEWLSAEGRVEVVSPAMARQRLTDEQLKELQEGQPRVMGEVARKLDADVLVQVQARPTRQTQRGLDVRFIAEAINVGRGGQSVASAVVEVPPPLDKPRLDESTRFLARKLMDGMTRSWNAMAEGGRGARDAETGRDRAVGDDAAAPEGDRLVPRDPPSRDLVGDGAAPPLTRPAPTTRPSAPPPDDAPLDNK